MGNNIPTVNYIFLHLQKKDLKKEDLPKLSFKASLLWKIVHFDIPNDLLLVDVFESAHDATMRKEEKVYEKLIFILTFWI